MQRSRILVLGLVMVLSGWLALARDASGMTPKRGGTLKVALELLATVPYLSTRKQGDFDGLISSHTLRFAPDDFYGRNLHSKSEYAQVMSGWHKERYDQLVEEAKRTLDPARRKALYTEAWSIVNTELPHFYLHEVALTSAAVQELKGYQPNVVGVLTYAE